VQRAGQAYGIRELNPRVKKELRNLAEEEGLGALVHFVLIEAVYHEEPPECVRTFIETAIKELCEYEVVFPVKGQHTEKCVSMLQQKESAAGKGSSLLALLRFLLSQGKNLVEDADEAIRRTKRDRFESSISTLCYLLDPKYICELPEPRSLRGVGTDTPETHCLLLRLHKAASHVTNLRRIAICVCEDPGSSVLRGLRHEVSHAFDRLEQKGVKVVYAHSWDVLRAEGNFDVVYVVGHTDRLGGAGEPVLSLDGRPKSSRGAAKALCGASKPPQLVVFNGCRSLVHAAPLLDCGVGHVICWETPVPDCEAVVFGEALVDELVKTPKVEVVGAFQKAHSKATQEGSSAWALPPGLTSPGSIPRPVIKRELSSQSNLGASTPKAVKRELSASICDTQTKGRSLKRRLTDANIQCLSSLASSEKRRRKLWKQPAFMKAQSDTMRDFKKAHSDTMSDEAIARAMQESSQEPKSDEAIARAMQESSQEPTDSPSDLVIAHCLQAEEADGEGCTVM
jgi:hypothetical protein